MIKITLSSAPLGAVDDVVFDMWTAHVADRIDAALGFDCDVHQGRLGEAGEDRIEGASPEQAEAIRRWLGNDGRDEFRGIGGPWETMRKARKAHEAA